MHIKNLAFVMLGAANLDRSIGFYRDTLGLTLSARFGDFAFLDTGSVTLILSGELVPADGAQREACEVVFAVDSVTQSYEALKDRIAFVNEPRAVNAQNWAVNFRDADGHSLSFYGGE